MSDNHIKSWKELRDLMAPALKRGAVKDRKVTWPVVLLLLAFGTGCLVSGLYYLDDRLTLLKNGIHAQGSVTKIESYQGTCHSKHKARSYTCTMEAPVIGYKDAQGKDQSFRVDFGMNRSPYKIGEAVDVVYLPDDLKSARVNAPLSMWTVPALLSVSGFFLLLGGIRHGRKLMASGNSVV